MVTLPALSDRKEAGGGGGGGETPFSCVRSVTYGSSWLTDSLIANGKSLDYRFCPKE